MVLQPNMPRRDLNTSHETKGAGIIVCTIVWVRFEYNAPQHGTTQSTDVDGYPHSQEGFQQRKLLINPLTFSVFSIGAVGALIQMTMK